jgi:GT2 family glycosyltransferase
MLAVCTPTLRKFDLCIQMIDSALAGTKQPDVIYVLDNSAGKFLDYVHEHMLILPDQVRVIVAEHNEGCEPGWNILMRIAMQQFEDIHTLIVNDDIQFYPDTIEKLYDARYQGLIVCAGGLEAPNAFSCFLTDPRVLFGTVGPFQENFYPAYYGDNDMHYRMKLMGYDLYRAEGCNARHGEGSATLNTFTPEERRIHDVQFQRNTDMYVRMWGGLPGKERYRVMFNGEDIMKHAMELYQKYKF